MPDPIIAQANDIRIGKGFPHPSEVKKRKCPVGRKRPEESSWQNQLEVIRYTEVVQLFVERLEFYGYC